MGKLFGSSGIYLLAGAGQQAVGFLLLPLYTNILSPADYGTLEILNTAGLIALVILSLSLPSAILKCYHRDCKSDNDRRAMLATSMVIGLPILALGCTLLLVRAEWLAAVLLGPVHQTRLVRLAIVWVFFSGASALLQALFRAREEALVLGTITLGTFTLLMFLNVYFVWSLRLGVEGVLLGNCVSTAAATLVSVSLLKGRAAARISPALIQPLMGFGVVMVPAALCGWVINMADRYLLVQFGQLATVGVYGLGYKLGMVLDVLIVAPFQLAWPSFAFAISEDEGHRHVYARTLTYLVLVSSVCVLGLTLLSPVVLHYASHPDYFQASTIVPLISLAYAFNGVFYCVSPGIHIRHRTRRLPVIMAGAAALNVALCLVWIPRFGMMGAAWATTAAFAFLAIATFVVAQRTYPVEYEYRRLAKICGAAIVVYLVSVLVPAWHPIVKALVDVGILLLGYPLMLIASDFLAPDERASLGRLLRRVVGRWQLTAPAGTVIREPGAAKIRLGGDLDA